MSGRSVPKRRHRLGVLEDGQRPRRSRKPGFGDQRHDQTLDHPHDLVAADERHLDVDLGELGLAVGAQVLVAEAARDLVVAVDAADHEDLLEELRRLRQRVERPAVDAARDQIVARPFRRAARQHRRFDLEEPGVVQVGLACVRRDGGGRRDCGTCAAGGDRGSGSGAARSRRPRRRPRRETGSAAPRSAPASRGRPPRSSPVGSSGFTVSGERGTHPAAHRDDVLERTSAPRACASGLRSGSRTTWTRPVRSRRSRKMTPP